MELIKNPFESKNLDYAALWEMLVRRDIKAFVEEDWSQVEHDFLPDKFYGINAHFSSNPQEWKLEFPLLVDYQKRWLNQSHKSRKKIYTESLRIGIHRATKLEKFIIKSNKAAVWKRFDGKIELANGTFDVLRWQTIYFCEFFKENWKITGFIGYLPL